MFIFRVLSFPKIHLQTNPQPPANSLRANISHSFPLECKGRRHIFRFHDAINPGSRNFWALRPRNRIAHSKNANVVAIADIVFFTWSAGRNRCWSARHDFNFRAVESRLFSKSHCERTFGFGGLRATIEGRQSRAFPPRHPPMYGGRLSRRERTLQIPFERIVRRRPGSTCPVPAASEQGPFPGRIRRCSYFELREIGGAVRNTARATCPFLMTAFKSVSPAAVCPSPGTITLAWKPTTPVAGGTRLFRIIEPLPVNPGPL